MVAPSTWPCAPSVLHLLPDPLAVSHRWCLVCALAVSFRCSSRFKAWLRKTLEGLIAIEADVTTLSEYFLRVNPYFNYAFQLENCYFIVLDTGPDCLTAQSFWDDGGKKVRRISIDDNILGGSPDTMGFYPANEFYPYSQISWLERVLSCIGESKQQDAAHPERRRIFVGLHAPPANLSQKKRSRPSSNWSSIRHKISRMCLWKNRRSVAVTFWMVMTSGMAQSTTTFSQFFYLCLGYREGKQDILTGPERRRGFCRPRTLEYGISTAPAAGCRFQVVARAVVRQVQLPGRSHLQG